MEQLETIRSYWNTRADGYSKSVMEEMEDAQKEGTYWKILLDTYLPKGDNPKVLDLGCGPGFFTMLLGQKDCQMTAFDYSAGAGKAERGFCRCNSRVCSGGCPESAL